MPFNEDSRVKIPTILHLVRLGYEYLSLKDAKWNESTNIFPDVFASGIARINPGIEQHEISRLLEEATLALANEDLGKTFYEMLTEQSGSKLIDFSNSEGTTFGSITKDDLFPLKPTYPNSRQLKAYDAIVSKCNDMIFINSNENQQLTQLRDWLLPMLMNSQVTVSDQSTKAQ